METLGLTSAGSREYKENSQLLIVWTPTRCPKRFKEWGNIIQSNPEGMGCFLFRMKPFLYNIY